MASSDKSFKHLLVIRLSALGDVAMIVPVLSALTHQNPQLKITVLTKEFCRPMFAQLDHVTVHTAAVNTRHKGLLGIWKLYKELKKLRFDAVIDLHDVLRSNMLLAYFRFGGVPCYQIDKGRAEKKALTSTKNKVFKALKTTHERYADVFARIGLSVDWSKVPLLQREKLSNKALTLIGSTTVKRIGIAPFAAHQGKMYPLKLIENVIEDLNASGAYRILLFGGGKVEQNKLERLAKKYRNCISVADKLSFKEELALISNLELMLSMDSANGHLAAMYGIPTLTLWGVTHPYAGFYPFGQDVKNALLANRTRYPLIPTSIYGNKMPAGYEAVMETIPPKDVVAKIAEILGYQF